MTQKEEEKKDKIKIVKVILFYILTGGVIALPSIVFAYIEHDDPCQRGKSSGMMLSTWLEGFAIEKFIAAGLVIILGIAEAWDEVIGLGLTDLLFSLIWSVIGIVNVATHHGSHCVSDKTGIGVMSLVLICYTGVAWYLSASNGDGRYREEEYIGGYTEEGEDYGTLEYKRVEEV